MPPTRQRERRMVVARDLVTGDMLLTRRGTEWVRNIVHGPGMILEPQWRIVPRGKVGIVLNDRVIRADGGKRVSVDRVVA